jgi:tetratricopeptide (TPR) repeat protein
VQEYSESLKRNPDDSKVYGNRAACYIKLAAFPLAIQDCDEATKREPTFIKAYIRKGNAFHAMKKYSEAISAYHKAADIDPNNSEVAEGLTKSRQAMMSNMTPEERQKAAMQNPEVQVCWVLVLCDTLTRCV